ncbi:MAG TPA: hypothetical protein HPP97_02270 [Desulfuromonadales bacterium]|nr:hypothetical protein [Desulfuromonadales bacterium]
MSDLNGKKLQRTMMVNRIVQTVLLALLFYLAINFQALFAQQGKPEQFFSSIVIAVVVQLLLIYPIYKLAWRDVGIEVDSSVVGITPEQTAALRKKRLLGEMWKVSGIAFFLVFAVMVPDVKKAPGARLVLAATIFSFLLTCLMYFQCFNFACKKRVAINDQEKS